MVKITESLWPLFVDNIGTLPAVIAAATHEQQIGLVETLGSQPLSLCHDRSIDNMIAPYPRAEGPGLDQAYPFPTLPTNTSSETIGSGSYDWANRTIASEFQSGQPMMTDSHPYFTSTTPETTPSGASTPTLQPCRSHPYYSAAAILPSFRSHSSTKHLQVRGGFSSNSRTRLSDGTVPQRQRGSHGDTTRGRRGAAGQRRGSAATPMTTGASTARPVRRKAAIPARYRDDIINF